MGFYLLGRGRQDGELRLISSSVYETRQDALDALTALSSAVGFAHGDADVFVADLDVAMPVLLVQAAPAAPEAPAVAEEPTETVFLEETVIAEEPAEGVVIEEAALEEVGQSAPEAGADVWEAPEPAAEAAIPAEQEVSDLAEALKRAAGALESAGIVAPESIGPAPDEGEVALAELQEELVEVPAGETPAEGQVFEEFVVALTEPEAVIAPEPVAPEPQAGSTSEPADTAWPWEAPAGASDAGEVAEVVEVAETTETAGAPGEPAVGYVYDPFEEPALDPGDMVRLSEDPDLAGRPVIMGAYTEPAPEEPEPEISGILADLEPIEEQTFTTAETVIGDETPVVAAVGASAPTGETLGGLTCDDCVYDNTCPNKGELDPSKCGNFQWRSA